MAGRGVGPAPKPNRRRRNKPERGDWVELQPLERPVLPELPKLQGEEWNPVSVATWEAWRASPVSGVWGPEDIAFALDTILLHNRMTPSNANEVRLRMDALGLTPKGKRDLRWRLPGDPASEKQDELPKLAEVRRLRALDATG